MINSDLARQRELWFRNNVIDKIESMLHGSESNVALVSFVVSENELIRLKQQYSDKFDDISDAVANYRVLQSLGTEIVRCQVKLGDKPLAGLHGTIFEFDAILTVSINEQEPNQALQFALRCALQSDISLVSNPL